MSIHRRAAKRDGNEPDIVQALERIGCTVLRLSGAGVPDLAVHHRGRWIMAEIKTQKGKLTDRQEWGPEVLIWRSVDEALRDLGIEQTNLCA